MKNKIIRNLFLVSIALLIHKPFVWAVDSQQPILPGGNNKWQLFWNDEFSYPNANLDNAWISANDSTQSNILCARIRRNAVVSNGTLKLINKKETVGTKAWTSGSVWTKRTFQYGYFECRYKYAAATGTNNSFWFITSGTPTVGKKFEIDVNEGHYPAEMATNIHNWSDITTNPTTGAQTHPSSSVKFSFTTKPDVGIQLEIPVTTKKIRLTTNYSTHFHIQEFRIYNVNSSGYPTVLSASADTDVSGLVNYARDPLTIITSSGVYGAGYEAANAADGTLTKHWVSQDAGEKWIEFDFPTDKTIGCIQFVSGWISGSSYASVLDQYKVQYFDGTNWVDIQSVDATTSSVDFGRDYHYLGLKWTADSLSFYHDGVLKRQVHNDFCYSGAPMYLSEAIITWAGAVTDAINGTQMEIDYVRAYQPVDPNLKYDIVVNGGFETLTSGLPTPWELNRTDVSNSSFSYVTADPASGTRALRVKNAIALPSAFSTNVAQKMPITSDGLYEIRLNARTTLSNAGANKISLKLKDEWAGFTNIISGDSIIDFTPTSTWQSYKFKLNLKQNYDNKLYIGISQYGNYDIDSVSVVRVGDVVSALPFVPQSDLAKVSVSGRSIMIAGESTQYVDVLRIDGRCVYSREILAGNNVVKMPEDGVYIVRLKNGRSTISKKVVINSHRVM